MVRPLNYTPTAGAALHYMSEQLREDMRTLYEYLRELEELNQTEDE